MNTIVEMKNPTHSLPIHITENDKKRLEEMIDRIKRSGKQEANMSSLEAELHRATVVKSELMPKSVVTMDSFVSIIDADSSEKMQFRLVFPEEADSDKNLISVLSPIGAGCLGFRIGDEFAWEVPAGIRKFKIAKVAYQPEAADPYRLRKSA